MKQRIDCPKMVKTYMEKQKEEDVTSLPDLDYGMEWSMIATQGGFDYLMSDPRRKIVSIENFYKDDK